MATISETENAMSEMRLILRYMQYEGGLVDGGRASLDQLADALDVTRDQLNRYFAQLGNRSDLLDRHRTISQNLYILLRDRKDLPPHVRAMLSDVYGEGAFPSGTQVVTSARVIGHRSLVAPSQNEDTRQLIAPLEGLNVIVRPANESVPRPTDDDPLGRTQGWSVSVLNIPPETVQTGDHHPLFKIRQIGQNRNEITVEGVVVPRSDRITLQGITLNERRSIQAVLTRATERMLSYRAPVAHGAESVSLLGVYTGVSSGGSAFNCLIEAFAVPDSTLPRNATKTERARFEDRYAQAKEASGVRELDGTIDALAGIDITVTRDSLLNLFQQSMKSPVLSAF